MYKYKLVQRSNPLVKGSPKKWYASPLSEAAQTVKAMTRAATENTTVAPKEMEAALELLGNYARQQLLQGHTVRVGDLGTLRITFKSDGVEDITKYNASAMIKEPRILFTPSREFREAVIGAIQFENGGTSPRPGAAAPSPAATTATAAARAGTRCKGRAGKSYKSLVSYVSAVSVRPLYRCPPGRAAFTGPAPMPG